MSSVHLDPTTGLWMAFKKREGEKKMWECYFQMVGEQKKPGAFSPHCESMKHCLLVRADAHSQQMGTWSLGFCCLASDGKKKKGGKKKTQRDQVCPDVLLHLASNLLVPFGKSWWETLVGEDKSFLPGNRRCSPRHGNATSRLHDALKLQLKFTRLPWWTLDTQIGVNPMHAKFLLNFPSHCKYRA